MRTRHLRGAKPSVHLVHEDRTTANNAVIMGDSRCLPNMVNSYKFQWILGQVAIVHPVKLSEKAWPGEVALQP